MNNQNWDIQDESDLKDAIRAETDYGTTRLPDSASDGTDINGVIDSAKRILALQADVTQFFDDRGIAVALLGISCVKAKGVVENSPVQVKDVSGQNVTFRTTDGSSLQVEQYEEMTKLGLSESDATDDAIQSLRFTNDYFSDNRGD